VGTAALLMVAAFVVLAKCADWLVEGAVDFALHLKVPPILIGIVIVSVGTTTPELAVSVSAALSGNAQMALGNAVGSVIYDDGLALPLVAFFSPVVVLIDKGVLRSAAIFLITVDLLAYFMAFDGTLSRGEGAILVAGFVCYLLYTYWEHRHGRSVVDEEELDHEPRPWLNTILLMAGGLVGVLVSSKGIVIAAPIVARAMGISNIIITLVVVALGTSIPEIATCIVAARKRQGALAIGNILGADILNICWIAGASAVVNDLVVDTDVIHFMFPAMILIVLTMLGLMRIGYRFERWKSLILLIMCVTYLAVLLSTNPGAISAHEVP